MNYTGQRLIDLENDTSGAGARVVTTVGGWTKIKYPNGEITATCGLDYTENTDFTWTESSLTTISENIPEGIFSEISTVECMPIDITPGATYINSIGWARKSLPSETTTGEFTLQSIEYSFGDTHYALPSKIHIVWIAKGM